MAKQTIIVMSDSHGDRAIVEEMKDHYLGKVDAIFHDGDSELPFEDEVWEGIHVVAGNMDFYPGYPERLVTDLDGTIIAQKLDLWAQEVGADICLYGHLHVPDAWMQGKTLFLNPGSISQPRGSINERLYAKVEIDDDCFKIDFYTRNHELYPSLSKEFAR